MFAQSVYLIFASVYMCKEAVEHLLLSAGDDQQHHADHHHHSDGYALCPQRSISSLNSIQGNITHNACIPVPGVRRHQHASF